MNYATIYEKLIERARSRKAPEGYTERHHVRPRCLGGSNRRSNIAVLTAPEHLVAHLLLMRMHPGNRGLIAAVKAMLDFQIPARAAAIPRNKKYGWVRAAVALAASEQTKQFYVNNPDAARQHSEKLKEHYRDPANRERSRVAQVEYLLANPDHGKIHSKRLKVFYENPAALEDMSKRVKKAHAENPNLAREHSVRMRKKCSDPEYTKKMSEKRRQESPLTLEKVREARSRYVPWDRVNGVRALAREFGVSCSTISSVIRGELWKDYESPPNFSALV